MSTMDVTLPIEHILNANPAFWRSDMGDLTALTDSILTHGVKIPVLVDGSYQLLDGARRVIAASKLSMDTIPVVVCNDFWAVHDEMIKAREAGKAEIFKGLEIQREITQSAELGFFLRKLYFPISRARANKKAGYHYNKHIIKRGTSTADDVANAMGVTKSYAEELSRIRALRARQTDVNIIRQMDRYLFDNRYGGVSLTLDTLRRIEKPIEVVKDRKRLADQQFAIPRAITSLKGALMALPDDLDPDHDPSDLAVWERDVNLLNARIYALRKKLRKALSTDEGDPA